MATRPRTLLADRTKAPLPCLGSLPSHSHRRSGHRRDEYQCDFRYFARIPFLMQPGFVRAKLDPDAGQPSDLEPSRSIGGRRDRFRRLVTTALPPNETNWLEHDLRDRFSILVDPDSLRTRLDLDLDSTSKVAAISRNGPPSAVVVPTTRAAKPGARATTRFRPGSTSARVRKRRWQPSSERDSTARRGGRKSAPIQRGRCRSFGRPAARDGPGWTGDGRGIGGQQHVHR